MELENYSNPVSANNIKPGSSWKSQHRNRLENGYYLNGLIFAINATTVTDGKENEQQCDQYTSSGRNL